MLEYKNKKYDNKWNFEQFIDVISQNYNSYSEELNYVKEAMNFKMINYRDEEEPICVNEIEIVIFIDDLYNILTYKSDDYKNYANFYRDFELKEGQTYEDLYELEEEKFVQLFKEMLDFINVKYEEDDFIKLKWKVIENYPHYREILLHLISNNPNTTYIKKLDYMENVYEKIKSGYKEYIEKYILILNKNESMQNVILKRKLENEGYEVIAKNENVVFIKKSENAQELEEQEIELILSLANKQLNMGVILVDITKEIKEILGTSNEDRNLKNLNYKKKIEWMIRQAFTKALIEKNKNATSYDEN